MVLRLRPLFLALSAALVGSLALSSCRHPAQPLRVGANVWPGYEPMFLARSLGYYEGQPIRLIDFSTSAEVARAYRNGLIDVAAITLDEALIAAQGQPGHRIVLVCDVSNGADVVLASPGITTIAELKGRRIGAETTVLGAYVLARALEHGGLTAQDVHVVPVPLAKHEEAFLSGRVDAIVTFEPHRGRLLAAGAQTLFDSSEMRGEIVDVLLTRNTLSRSQEDALRILVSGWFRALRHLRTKPEDAATRVAHRQGVTPQQFLASLNGMVLPDRGENIRLLSGATDGLHQTMHRVSSVMVAHKFIANSIEPPALDGSIVGAAKP